MFIWGVIIITPLISLFMVQLSSVQQYLKNKTTDWLSGKTGMEVTISHIRVVLPFYYRLEGFRIRDHHQEEMVRIASVDLLVQSLDPDKNILKVSYLGVNNPYLYQKRYDGEDADNLSLFIQRLGSGPPKETKTATPITVRCQRLTIRNGQYHTNLDSKPHRLRGIDFQHMDLTGIQAKITNISHDGSITSMKVDKLSLREKTGFHLQELTAFADISPTSIRIRSMNLETHQTALALDLSFHYPSLGDFSDFEHKVYIKSEFGVSTLSTYDLGFFIPEFYLTNNQINLKGSLEGFLNRFEAERFQFSIGSTSFDGDIAMVGLPDLENTMVSLDINHLIADPEDILRFHFNNQGVITSLPLPAMAVNLGKVSVMGTFNGTIQDFYTNATFSGGFGFISADMQMKQSGGGFTVMGSLGVEDVDGGQLLRHSDLGKVSFDAEVAGSGSAKSWELDIASAVHSLDYRGYTYHGIDLKGKVIDRMFKGTVDIDDQNLKLGFDGTIDFNNKVPAYNFTAEVTNANLANLRLVNDSVRGLLSARMTIDIQGNHPDNLAGLVNIEFAEFKTPTRNYELKHFDLSAFTSPDNHRKLIAIRSDYVDGDIHGNFRFEEIGYALGDFLKDYITGILPTPQDISIDSIRSLQNDVHFNLIFKNTGNITQLLTGTRIETRKLTLGGSFLPDQGTLRLYGGSDWIMVNGQRTDDWYFNSYVGSAGFVVETGARQHFFSDTLGVFEPYWTGTIHQNLIDNSLSWKFDPANLQTDAFIQNTIDVSNFPNFNLTFSDGTVIIKDTLWRIREGSSISFMENSVDINNFVFFSHGQQIQIDGKSAEKSDNTIHCRFQQIDLSWIDFLTIPQGVNLDGILDGTVSIRNLWSSPMILADLVVQDFAFNEEPLGWLQLNTVWDNEHKGLKCAADFIYQGNVGSKKTGQIEGYIYPLGGVEENFDLKIDLDNFRINILSGILSDITTDIRGFASGRMNLNGTFREPLVTGKLKVNARNMLIDYLNTWYSFADTLVFTKNAIHFNQVQLSDNNRLNSRDPYSGVLNGSISHNGFRDFKLNLSIKVENFTFLNTNGQQDPAYFGRALATGNVSMTGPVDDILITVYAKTERNTTLEIPLLTPSEVSRGSFITFIDRTEGVEFIPQTSRKLEESNLQLNFNLQVTPDATVRLVFDPLVGDVIEGSGSGNLLMNVDSKGAFDLKGQYVISKGDYTFNLENLISKKFSIRNGGTIRWTGDPYDAIMDIEAVYSTKASLAPLNMGDSSLGAQNVECIIHLTGNLFNPNPAFSVNFPDLNTFDNEKYQALVKPNINYHFLSLLAISRFVNTQSEQFIEAGSSANIAGANTTEIISNQLSVWLSNISDEFDVDFAYHPGTGLTPEQLEAAIKTQVLNDRLTLESKVGIGGKTYAGNAEKTSNMVGDITAEYRIDREGRFRVKAYNRHNEHNILYEGAPYTQGLGVFYRKEFNSLRDLFRKRERVQE